MSEPACEDGFCKDNPVQTVTPPEQNEPSNMSVEDVAVSSGTVVEKKNDGPIEDSPAEGEAIVSNAEIEDSAAPVEDAGVAGPVVAAGDGSVDAAAPAGDALVAERRNRSNRPRNRFRGRNYRLRSNSSGSERAAQDDSNDPDVEAMIRRLVDEINQEVSFHLQQAFRAPFYLNYVCLERKR